MADIAIRYPPLTSITKPKTTKPFRFKVNRSPGSVIIPRSQNVSERMEQEIYMINGQETDSKEEWFIYMAMVQAGIPTQYINYQVPWHGGRSLGGQVLDFLITLGGTRTAIRVMGKYWHPTEYGTPLDVFSGAQMRGEGIQVHDVWDINCRSIDEARSTLRREGIIN